MYDSEDILKAALREDTPAAMAALFEQYAAGLLGYAGKFVSRETAEDIIQDVFIQLHRQAASLEIKHSIRHYLFRAVHNKCLDQIKHDMVHKRYVNRALAELRLQELAYYDPASGHESLLINAADGGIWQAIEQLPPKCREIVKLRYQEGLKTREISDAMGISSRTVETQLYKAIKLLKGKVRKLSYLFWSLM
ncbi:RNA polymerase sigma-70 factor [uncultured Chitinophaga sp.]|jgi:RNA polymerase sigma-70 factor, Bacteroides expansion family 1|uniref:RNA polymerase sigma-70 factor n=1 Tax=uncultured Chitinophaga sp. TaxID=339340 RepID=UPI002632BA46|nr:RNA polymerase sigma-70 factor [uncultured Chitinophaga sp.]